MVRFLRRLTILVPFVVAGCAQPPVSPSCAPGTGAPMAVFTLYLGKSIPGRGDLTDTEWRIFQDDVVTANLPNGYTVLNGNGGWMNPITRQTIKAATRVLVAALPEAPESLAAIQRIRSDYQLRFRQQLVGMTVTQACGTF